MRLRICKWAEYQHYKDRNPPWIKLHYAMLSSRTWVMLNDASRVLAIASMLIASKEDGEFEADPEYFKRVAYLNTKPDWEPLIKSGFCEVLQADASALLADASMLQADARPEKRREEERRGEQRHSSEQRLQEKRVWAVGEWNKVAEDRGWPKVSKVPAGETGELLTARVKDDWWVKNYPQALSIVAGLRWPDKPKPGKKPGLRFVAMLRGDSVRAIIDGEWSDGGDQPQPSDVCWEPTSEEAERLWPHLFGGTQA